MFNYVVLWSTIHTSLKFNSSFFIAISFQFFYL